MNDELRVDHHAEGLDRILHLFFASAVWVGEYVTDLSEYFTEVLPFLLITVNLDKGFLDLVQEGLHLEHLLYFVQVFVLALLRVLKFIICFLPKQDAQIIPMSV
jgi:hypothetical protein